MASLTSVTVMLPRLMSRPSSASGMLVRVGGSGRFRMDSKCCFHLFSFSSSQEDYCAGCSRPSASWCSGTLYSCHCARLLSPLSASLSMYLLLSLLADVFTTFSFSVYSFEIISLSLRDLVSNSFFLIRLRSSI
ncbi:hypothetical protein DPMN_010014 [Dreissena polymorpha]|uniref:Uncharacterized protein n=1 Tax=Dreissena polymorpha TaxID=45954 RepID=A0A9D4N198_DREPO|nr:hypothetical protein DPMN_010014 [Dreissena polymorpha]